MNRQESIVLSMIAVLTIASLVTIVLWTHNAHVVAPYRVFQSNPVLGSHAFVKDAHGFLAANGFAYSYVTLDTAIAMKGSTFTMLPALNVQVPNASNFTAIVTYGGFDVTGFAFDVFLPALGIYWTDSSNALGYGPATNLPGGGWIYMNVQGNLTFFLYVGPPEMPPLTLGIS